MYVSMHVLGTYLCMHKYICVCVCMLVYVCTRICMRMSPCACLWYMHATIENNSKLTAYTALFGAFSCISLTLTPASFHYLPSLCLRHRFLSSSRLVFFLSLFIYFFLASPLLSSIFISFCRLYFPLYSYITISNNCATNKISLILTWTTAVYSSYSFSFSLANCLPF